MLRHIYYTIQTLIRGRSSNVIKIISLTLGLFVGLLLFARVAFELSYDHFYPESRNLFLIQASYSYEGKQEKPSPYIYGAMPAAIRENFPDEVEEATVLRNVGQQIFFKGNERFDQQQTIYADDHFLPTMGVEVLKGNKADLVAPDAIFINESLARRVFGDADPIGQTMLWEKNYPVTVRGVFADQPENTDLKYDVIVSFATLYKRMGEDRAGWGYDISYMGVVRFHNDTEAPERVAGRLPEMHKKYLPQGKDGFSEEYSFQPISEYHSSQPEVRKMVLIMSVLAFAILLIAALNYVLISVSSLARRAKAVGVHKCSGASDGNIFGMFLWETMFIILSALVLVGLLILNLRELIQDTLNASVGALFTWETLWVPLLVIAVVFFVAGVIPGYMFSSIPVSQVFRRYTERKTTWKRPLLFVQFAGVPFVFGLLAVVLLQYYSVMNRELNYNPERIAVARCYFSDDEVDNVRSDMRRLPMVEDVAFAWFPISDYYSGFSVYNSTGKLLFDAHTSMCDYHFLSMMGVQLIDGKNFDSPKQAIVNEEFVRKMHWEDSAVGKQVNIGTSLPVVGVAKDFPIRSAYTPQDIVMYISSTFASGATHVRLKEPFDQNLKALNQKMGELFTTKDIVFIPLQEIIDQQYEAIRRFRDSVIIASISILLITLMGLFGYTNDEVSRRCKEIAIRKVNGAEAGDVLQLLSRDIFWTALPAVLLGAAVAWFVGGKWLEQFSDAIVPSAWLYLSIALVVLLLIVVSVMLRAWKVANENPVNSIKSE